MKFKLLADFLLSYDAHNLSIIRDNKRFQDLLDRVVQLNLLKLFVLVGTLLLEACSLVTTDENSENVVIEPADKKKEALANKEVVSTSIEPDVLYMLLIAEIAGQRKQYDIAMEGYLRAAKRVNDVRISERAAKIALYLKDERKTEDAVALWLSQQPDNLDARKIALLSALKAENKTDAIEHMSYLVEADPAGFERTMFELLKALQGSEQDDFVFEALDELSIMHPDQASIPFVQAVLSAQMGNNFVAREKVAAALQIQPDWNKALLLQAQLAVIAGKPDEAKAIIEAAIEKDPENIQLQKLLANVLIKSDDLEGAVKVFEKILQQEPDDEETQYALALVYLQLDQTQSAKDLFARLVDTPRYQMQASMHLGRIEIKQGNVGEGLVWFDRVTDESMQLEADVTSISVLMDEKQFQQAELRIQKVRHKYPEQSVRFALLEAEVYNSQKKYQKAFDILSHALESNPQNSDLLYTRALIAERMDRLDILEADLQTILHKNPNNVNALNALGYTLADKTERLSEAEGYLLKALQLQPEEPVIIDSYGWLLFRQGKPEEALPYLEKAYEQVREGEIAAHLVEVLWETGKQQQALKVFNQALEEAHGIEPLLELQKKIPGLQ